jgi:hypothetical protein
MMGDSPSPAIKYPQPDLVYKRPTEKMKLPAYLFDAFGPYLIAGAVIIVAVNQSENTPPEWGQGASADFSPGLRKKSLI